MQLIKKSGALFIVLMIMAHSGIKSQDLGIPSFIYPVDNQNVHLQYTYEIEFVLKNYGPNDVPKGTVINFDLLLDKTLINSYNLTLNNNPVNNGDSLMVTIPPLTFSSANPTIEMCLVVRLGTDLNPLNDTLCNLLQFSIDNNVDLEPKRIDIVVPARDSILTVGESILKMEGYIFNSGTVTLPRDYEVSVEYTMYTTKRSIKSKTTTALAPNGNFVINMIGIPALQTTPGSFDVCLKVLNGDDVNTANNEYCYTFYVVKDHSGISDQKNKGLIQSQLEGNNLIVNFTDLRDRVSINLYNHLGQAVLKKELDAADGQFIINTESFIPGLYILNVSSEQTSNIHTNKFYFR